MTDNTKVLFVNAGVKGLTTELANITPGAEVHLPTFVLSKLNALGKSAHALIKRDGKFFVVDHTARKGASKIYFEHETKYHPYMGELA